MILYVIGKIKFEMFGLDLLEPNVLITDTILGILSVYFGYQISKMTAEHSFFRNWKRFLILFGLGTILGGLGHALYNYLGIPGKTPGWLLGIISVFFIEISMISIHPNNGFSKKLAKYSTIKLLIVLSLFTAVLFFADPVNKTKLSITLVIINSFLGVTISAGGLGLHYYKIGLSEYYRYLVIGVLIMIPSSAVFLLDLNPFPWFDKNDLSHLILAIGITFFYLGLLRLYKQEEKEFEIDLF